MRVRLEDLPPAMRRQVEEQLALSDHRVPPLIECPQAKIQADAKNRMNGTEHLYSQLLDCSSEVAIWKFETIKLRLADRTWYTPDFFVIKTDASCEFHEVKGFWRDDARVKIKVAAELFPMFRFIAIQKVDGEWKTEEF